MLLRARPGWIVAMLAACAACVSDSVVDPTPADAPSMRITVVAGDRQPGIDGDTLPLPIVAKVTDLSGVPQAQVEVTWVVNDHGQLTTSATRTDEQGLIRATWILGANEDHEGSVHTRDGAAAAFTAAEPALRTLDLQEVDILRPTTFEGSRQTIHPDFVRTPDNWGAYTEHLALTPYRNSNTRNENPSLYVSRSGYRWFPQAGISNPITHPTDGSYLSDPDLVYEPIRRELWMYYREVDTKNRIKLVRSRDGVTWTDPRQVVEADNQMAISPSVVRRSAHDWRMWSVNGGTGGCNDAFAWVEMRHSLDGLHWSRPRRLKLDGGDLDPWHIDVQWIPELQQYWALFPVKTPSNCSTQALYLATSANGLDWTTFPSPVIVAGDLPELTSIVYRSTFEYIPERDELRFWFSGANETGVLQLDWRTVVQRWKRSDLMQRVNLPRIAGSSSRATRAPAHFIAP